MLHPLVFQNEDLNEAYGLGNKMIETNIWSGLWKASWEGVSLNFHGWGSIPFQIPGIKAIDNPSFRYLHYLALFIRASFKEEIRSMSGLVETLSDVLISALCHFPHIRFSLYTQDSPFLSLANLQESLMARGTRCLGSDTSCQAWLLCSVTQLRLVCISSSKRNSDALYHNLYN